MANSIIALANRSGRVEIRSVERRDGVISETTLATVAVWDAEPLARQLISAAVDAMPDARMRDRNRLIELKAQQRQHENEIAEINARLAGRSATC